MNTSFKKAFEYKVIYVFTVDDQLHQGYVKIGDATLHTELPIDKLSPNSNELNQAALHRIKQYTNTVGITPHLLHSELAVRTINGADGEPRLVAFRDYNVHAVLRNSKINNVTLGESSGNEWFPVDLETAKKAIDAVKNGYANLSNTGDVMSAPIIFRPEQAECIDKVVRHFKKADRFLINAKMRYGKTFVSLEIVKRCKFKKTIILTHRPVVDTGWYEDFTKIFCDTEDYMYGSKATGYTVDQLIGLGKSFIYFASIQDLRGSAEVGGKFEKNNAVFDTIWDCVIVDEAHEGTTTALGEDTVKAVFKEGLGTKLLALSGTPFNILVNYSEDSIYTWDYVMEQENKSEWDKLHFGDSNPYDELPEMRIYTYSLGDILHNSNYITYEDKAFNFHEFFRVFTGDFKLDYANMPDGAEVGDFVHEADVRSFLNLMTKEDSNSQYPFSTVEYRSLFKHTLWMVPGVKEARALKKLMLRHPVFGSGQFDIVNVAGSGDEEEKSEEALAKVRHAINSAKKDGTYTITISCGKLTAGVTVKEWTAVFMLAGSYSTSAAQYLQTIFRVQSPCNEDGKVKENAYVFDFAPDRTLKMVSSAVKVSSRAGKTKTEDKEILGKFLNYCPVISISGSGMQEYSATRLLQQLKRAYADKVVRNGFDDASLYNDELLKLDQLDIKKFDALKKIIGKSKAAPRANDIVVNDQGLTNEEYEEEGLKKPQRELTPEEKARLEELKKRKKIRKDAISILRGISIRMPLMIYGADISYEDELTLDQFVDLVDDTSWKEYMPDGVSKKTFRKFQKYYDEEVFIAAGRQIRNVAKQADSLDPTERVKRIAGLFSRFKNPDKETVLTPWRAVNMHMSECLGGWCFYDDSFNAAEPLDQPRYVDHECVTRDVFGRFDARILEINSKTGLYPLFVTYSVYRTRLNAQSSSELSVEDKRAIWMQTVKDNIFVVCKTPMAKSITRRTLVGYTDESVNAHYFNNLVDTLKNKPQRFINKVSKKEYWEKGNGNMTFDAIVGNPPYQLSDGGNKASAMPIFQYFVSQAIELKPNYISMIMPAKWYSGGRNLDAFRDQMLNDDRISALYDFADSNDCFTGVDIAGGLCYFLWDSRHSGSCTVVNRENGRELITERTLSGEEVFIRNGRAFSIIEKVRRINAEFYNNVVSSQKPFGLRTYVKPTDVGDIVVRYSGGKGPYKRELVTAGIDWIDKWKVIMSYLTYDHAGRSDKEGRRRIFSTMEVLAPGEVCTETYIVIDTFSTEQEARNLLGYLRTKFVRYLVAQVTLTQHISKSSFVLVPIQDFSKPWADADLYDKYKLTKDEITDIDEHIKSMD